MGEGWDDARIVEGKLVVHGQASLKDDDNILIKVTATDPHGLSETLSFFFEVMCGPRALRLLDPIILRPGGEAKVTLTDYLGDPLGRPLTFAIGPNPMGLVIAQNGPILTISALANAATGRRDFTVIATDADGRSEYFIFFVSVRGSAERPQTERPPTERPQTERPLDPFPYLERCELELGSLEFLGGRTRENCEYYYCNPEFDLQNTESCRCCSLL